MAKEQVKLASLTKVRCPQCGGKINRVWLSSFDFLTGKATFIAECWSGNLKRADAHENYHIFAIRVPVNAVVEVEEEKSV